MKTTQVRISEAAKITLDVMQSKTLEDLDKLASYMICAGAAAMHFKPKGIKAWRRWYVGTQEARKSTTATSSRKSRTKR